MKKIIIDIDNTLTIHDSSFSYENMPVRTDVKLRLEEYKKMGFEIILFTARNMRTHNGDIKKIELLTLPILEKWLEDNSVIYDSIIIGKPWCGYEGFYVDDRSIRPDEFVKLNYEEIQDLIK